MKKRISNIEVFQAGKVQAVTAFCMGLIFIPFGLIGAVIGLTSGRGLGSAVGGIIFTILIPLLAAFGGFVGGLITALVYNLVAGWTGGIEFTITDVAPPAGLPGSYSPTTYQQ